MRQDTPSRKLDQYIVRFPDGMRDQLKAAAKASGRSMNAEIIARLSEWGDAQDRRREFTSRLIAALVVDRAFVVSAIKDTDRTVTKVSARIASALRYAESGGQE